MKTIPFLLLSTAIIGWASQARAQSVDLELAFLLDSSGSIGSTNFTQQKTAFANIFGTNFYTQYVAPLNGATLKPGQIGTGRVAVSFWSFGTNATGTTTIVTQAVPWTLIASQSNANTVAAQISSIPFIGGRSPIGPAIQTAATSIFNNTFTSIQSVIDVATDGRDLPASDNILVAITGSDFARCGGSFNASNAACYADSDIVAPNGVNVLNTISSLTAPNINVPLLEEITYGTNLLNIPGKEFYAPDGSQTAFQTALTDKLRTELGVSNSPGQVPEPSLAFGLIGLGIFGIGKKCLSRRG